ncbi:unnamed protein product [Bursaphelenchus xylophilus]|nr:unnamed protein product [Bursaphelenchus xylophilus]CAG9126489.1 unnamed protein product [Bursaphelenchus xylophilus]
MLLFRNLFLLLWVTIFAASTKHTICRDGVNRKDAICPAGSDCFFPAGLNANTGRFFGICLSHNRTDLAASDR